MIEPETAFSDLSDNAALAEAPLKYTFAALLNERQDDLAFFRPVNRYMRLNDDGRTVAPSLTRPRTAAEG